MQNSGGKKISTTNDTQLKLLFSSPLRLHSITTSSADKSDFGSKYRIQEFQLIIDNPCRGVDKNESEQFLNKLIKNILEDNLESWGVEESVKRQSGHQ